MTVTATEPQASPGPAPAKAPRPPSPLRGITPLTPMRRATARSMRKLADQVQKSHPGMIVHEHLRDAAKQVEKGNEDGAQRHLRAAMFSLTPQSLYRNGQHTDDAHLAARQAMHSVHQHLLLTKDITDAAARNQAVIRKDSGDGAAVPPPRPDPNAGYGPGANAQQPTVRQPPGDQALNAPATANPGDPSVADPGGPQAKAGKQFAMRAGAGQVLDLVGPGGFQHGWKPGGPTAADHDKAARLHAKAAASAKDPAVKAKHTRRAKVHTQIAQKLRSLSAPAALAYGWDDLLSVVDLSAKTAALESTPAPYGKPGGPGLYGVRGNAHSPYFEQVVQALMTRRGMDKATASKIAWGALRKWGAGGGHVSPEVQSAATGALGKEAAAGAKAHSHATTWDDVLLVIELAFNPAEARVPAGGATAGQFAAGGAAAQPATAQPAAKGKQPAKAPAKPKLDAHQQHVAHVAHTLGVSTPKASLLVSAQDDRAKAAALIKQRDTLAKELASASGTVSSGQGGSTTSANSTTSTTAPATTASTASTASTAASTTPAASTTSASTPAASTSASSASKAQISAQINQINTQIKGLLQSAAQATAQAAKMK